MLTWAYIYEHPGTDPRTDRHVLERDGQRTLLVPVADPALAPDVARALITEGVSLIELCGGFPLAAAAEVAAAVDGRVPVGHVTFAVESVRGAAGFGETAESGIARLPEGRPAHTRVMTKPRGDAAL